MKTFPLRLLALATIASLLAGCGAGTSGSTTSTAPSLTGNWFFTTLYPGNVPQNVIYAGALNQSGTNITAVLHNSCFSTQDIDLSGSEDSSGNLTLTSNNLSSNVVTIAGAVTITSGVIQTSRYSLTVTGSAPCALATTTLSGSQIPLFTGNFAGSLTSTQSATATFTVDLTQGAANTDGEFPLSGTVTASSSTCTVTFPVNLLFAGSAFSASVSSITSPISTAVLSAGPVTTGSSAALTNVDFVITGCNAGTFVGSLNHQ